MSCKSVLYATNTTPQNVVSGNIVNFGNIIRRYGCNTNLIGGNAVLLGQGYYDIDASVVVTASAAGTETVTLYKDGIAIPGATATFTVAAGQYTLNVPAIVRNYGDETSGITAVYTGVDAIVTNASIKVEKL